jgi:hypothetical protein
VALATPSLAILMLLVTIVLWWWSFVWFSDLTSETIAAFLPRFGVLVAAFLMMAAALPDDVPESGIDLRQFYFSSRIHLWSLMSLTLGGIILVCFADNWSVGMTRLLAATCVPMISLRWQLSPPSVRGCGCTHSLSAGFLAAKVHNNLYMLSGSRGHRRSQRPLSPLLVVIDHCVCRLITAIGLTLPHESAAEINSPWSSAAPSMSR